METEYPEGTIELSPPIEFDTIDGKEVEIVALWKAKGTAAYNIDFLLWDADGNCYNNLKLSLSENADPYQFNSSQLDLEDIEDLVYCTT